MLQPVIALLVVGYCFVYALFLVVYIKRSTHLQFQIRKSNSEFENQFQLQLNEYPGLFIHGLTTIHYSTFDSKLKRLMTRSYQFEMEMQKQTIITELLNKSMLLLAICLGVILI